MKPGSSLLIARLAVAAGLCASLASFGGGSTPASPSAPAASCAAGAIVQGTPGLIATRLVAGLSSPLDLQSAPNDRARLFVVEQTGRIRVIRSNALVGAPFLDISARISSGGERGLLGLAFHPQYAANGRFFVNYTDRNGDTHISEFRASNPSADTADAEREIVFIDPLGS